MNTCAAYIFDGLNGPSQLTFEGANLVNVLLKCGGVESVRKIGAEIIIPEILTKIRRVIINLPIKKFIVPASTFIV